jgi:hypothetical protein
MVAYEKIFVDPYPPSLVRGFGGLTPRNLLKFYSAIGYHDNSGTVYSGTVNSGTVNPGTVNSGPSTPGHIGITPGPSTPGPSTPGPRGKTDLH